MWHHARTEVRHGAIGVVRAFVAVVREALASYQRHRGSLLGAALAFYTLLSIAPLLVVAVAIAGVVFGEGNARMQLMRAIEGFAGERAAAMVGAWTDEASAASSEATVIGLVLFALGASRVFAQLESTLDAVWDAPVKEHESVRGAVRWMVVQRAISFVLVLGFGLVIAGSLVAQTVLDLITVQLADRGVAVHLALRGAHAMLSIGVLTLAFALAFRRAPHRHVELHETWIGAMVTALLFSIGNALLGAYFARVDVGAAYGAAGSVIVVLLWLAFSGQILVFGAELTRVVAMRGGHVRAREGAPPWVDDEPVASVPARARSRRAAPPRVAPPVLGTGRRST
ncbi:YihY/virulence factor BrkB family protein [Sandaracinus amylolyticus]|nr:YihY/virulence factor BrkB family protein [Sandaracinus amylolyticus]